MTIPWDLASDLFGSWQFMLLTGLPVAALVGPTLLAFVRPASRPVLLVMCAGSLIADVVLARAADPVRVRSSPRSSTLRRRLSPRKRQADATMSGVHDEAQSASCCSSRPWCWTCSSRCSWGVPLARWLHSYVTFRLPRKVGGRPHVRCRIGGSRRHAGHRKARRLRSILGLSGTWVDFLGCPRDLSRPSGVIGLWIGWTRPAGPFTLRTGHSPLVPDVGTLQTNPAGAGAAARPSRARGPRLPLSHNHELASKRGRRMFAERSRARRRLHEVRGACLGRILGHERREDQCDHGSARTL